MEISKFLSKVIGLYLIIISLAMWLNMPEFTHNTLELINNPAVMFVSGFFTLILGLLLVVSHNIWQWNWRVIITIIAWISLVKGIMLIIYPGYIDMTTHLFVEHSRIAYTAAGIDFILGVILSYFGFRE